MRLRTIIADDEPLARDRLRALLGEDPEVVIAAECADGASTADQVTRLGPDLLFLDVQMPAADGFAALARIPRDRLPPAVVFVTAHDEHAVRAFEVHAVDYLLKPFSAERFAQALSRAKERIRSRRTVDVAGLLRTLASPPDRLVVRSGGRVSFLPVDELDWAQAADNYVELHAGREVHLLRETLTRLEDRLDPRRFVRVHRSTLVNVARVRELRPLLGGDHEVLLLDGTRLVLSRTYREALHRLLDPAS
jgi:two-component system LytT family response regulator